MAESPEEPRRLDQTGASEAARPRSGPRAEQDNPEAPKDEGATGQSKKPRSPYASLPMNLREEELKQTGVQKMLLGEVDRLQVEVGELKEVRARCETATVNYKVLQARFQQYTWLEVLYTLGIGIAFTIAGYLISVPKWEWRQTAWAVAAGIVLLVAIVAKHLGVKHED